MSAILDFRLNYRSEVSGYVFIRFLAQENHIIDTKILTLGAIRKKLAKPPTAMAAILDFGLWGQGAPLFRGGGLRFAFIYI